MNEQRILIHKTDSYVTDRPNACITLIKGRAGLYVVRWDPAAQAPGRRILLCEMQLNANVPALCWTQQDGAQWRFEILPMENDTELWIREDYVTAALKRNFLRTLQLGGAEMEGFEGAMAEFFRRKELEEAGRIAHAPDDKQKAVESAGGAMKDAVEGDKPLQPDTDAPVYNLLARIAPRCGLTLMPYEKLVSRACDMTLPAIAKASGFICRKVVLDADWYRNDCGVIFGDRDGQPVACLPVAHGYLLVTPDGREEPLTRRAAMEISPAAHVLRRTLPRRSLTRKDLFAFVKGSFRRSEWLLLGLWTLLCALIGVLLPELNQLIYDEYIPLGETSVLLQVGLVIASFMLGNVFITIVKQIQEFRIPARAGYEMQDALFHRVFQLPESFFRKYDSGDMAERLTGADTLTTTLVSKAVTGVFSLLMALVYLIQMARYSGKLTLVSVAMILLYGCGVYFVSILALKHRRASAEFNGEANGKLIQLIQGVDKIRMAGVEEKAILAYTLPVTKEKQAHIRAERNEAVVSVLVDAGATLFSMVLYYMMVKSKLDLSLGAFLAFNTAFGSLTSAVMGLVQGGVEVSRLKPTIERLKPFVDAAPEVTEGRETVQTLRGDIRLENVSFSYQEGGQKVISNLSMHIRAGEYVALVGSSGCGKSTLLKLLVGFEKPQEGSVLYDDRDLATLDQQSLRRKMGIVLQNGRLIDGSIYENITVTAAEPSMKQVMKTVEDVGLAEDIKQMPMGVQTMLSDASDTISGGQRQRILIARAIYGDPAVLFFDEATSALDNVTQAKVCENLEKRQMTRLVIAHRLSTVEKCDRIYVMDKGSIVESGSYEELMAKGGLFSRMASRQLAEA